MATAELSRARFPGLSTGYESFYLRAADPRGGLGFWIRYTVHRAPGRPPSGSLWCTLFDAAGSGPVATKLTVPDLRADGGGTWLHIGEASVGPGRAVGEIAVPSAPTASWDLAFSGADAYPHLPRRWMYDAPLPRTKPVSLHPAARFEGTLHVGDRTVSVTGWPGMVGHNWGTEHAERWIWLHGSEFGGQADAWIDVVLARLRLGRWTTPWSGFGTLSIDGHRHELGGLARARSTRVEEHPDRATFVMTGPGLRVRGRIGAPSKDFVGWVYADPDGGSHDVAHCSIADLELALEGEAVPPGTLRAGGTAAYELGMREHDHGVTIQPFPDG